MKKYLRLFLFFVLLVMVNLFGIYTFKYIGSIKSNMENQSVVISRLIKERDEAIKHNLVISKEYGDMIDEYATIVGELKMQVESLTEVKRVYDPIIARAKSYKKSDTAYMTYDFLESTFKLVEVKGINPHLIFAIIDNESNFHPNIKGTYSKVIGLGQITDFTGKFIHTNLLKSKSVYHHESLINPIMNVSYMIEYMVYLTRNGRSYDRAIKEYCGGFMKGYETFYETRYRPKLITSLMSFGMTKNEADMLLKSTVQKI